MIVVIQTVLAPVGHEDVGPAIVVIIGDCGAESPAVVGDTGLGGYIREGSVVIVMK